MIADMLIEITPAEAAARLEAAGAVLPEDENLNMVKWAEGIEQAGGHYPLYTCRHWDPQTKLCTVYDERPAMCRDYPYDGRCNADCACSYTPPTETRTKWQAIRVKNTVIGAGRVRKGGDED
jgi:Fe-S-cluster containining protein